MSKREEWEAMSDEAQYLMVCKIIAKVAKRLGVKVNPLDHAGEVWITVTERIDESELDLPLIVWRAATSAIKREACQLRKYAEADNFTVAGTDGDGLGQVLDLVAGSGSVESEAILRADFSAFYECLDERNKTIINRRITGEAQERIADELKVSYPAVWKRLHRMRGQVAEFTY